MSIYTVTKENQDHAGIVHNLVKVKVSDNFGFAQTFWVDHSDLDKERQDEVEVYLVTRFKRELSELLKG